MNNFIFENVTKVYFGKGCVKEYLSCLTGKYGEKILLAYGGGSVMDCCKAVSMAAVSTKDIWEEYWAKPGIVDFEPLPLGVIVTVAGTGSECNGGAVITNEALKIKTGRDYPKCNPKFALMDPEYTYSVPIKQMASGGFDILSHIMETYFSEPNEDNVSDDISEALMRSVIKNLRDAIRNPEDYTARSNLMWASTMAENRIIKLGKKCDFECHQMEHQLGAYTDCNHGCGLAVLHPVYYRHIYKEGKLKAIGVSNFYPHTLTNFCETVEIIPMVNQVELHPYYVQEKSLQVMKQYQVQPEAWAPLGGGRYTPFENEMLQEIAANHGKTVGQVILRWNAQRGVVVIPKSTHKERIEENLAIWDFTLSEEEMQKISSLDMGYQGTAIKHFDPEFVRMCVTRKIHD